ncbi:MAG: hypothetical protein HGB32_15860 [Geobacteraceae bacterium]|nr:hypothetical protein [Geobacteraceae bacterium]NTW81598.1 hypothetical protein [Geobacteraceae bacterium]
MEPITLCGAIILAFGLWVEFEPKLRVVLRVICNSKLFKEVISQSTVQRPVYVKRMPLCFAKASQY